MVGGRLEVDRKRWQATRTPQTAVMLGSAEACLRSGSRLADIPTIDPDAVPGSTAQREHPAPTASFNDQSAACRPTAMLPSFVLQKSWKMIHLLKHQENSLSHQELIGRLL